MNTETRIITKAEMRAEGVERMKMLNLFGNVTREFRNEGKVNYSETVKMGGKTVSGILYWLDDDMKEEIKKFEEKYNCMVYHVIRNFTQFGELLVLLYVSSDVEEWKDDRNDLKEMVEDINGVKFYNPFAYVINRTDPECSEFGRIGIIPCNGGIKRIY